MSQYPPGGAIFPRDKKTQQSPDFDGYIEIDDAMLSDIATEIQQSPDRRTKVHVALWKRQSRDGKNFMSAKPQTHTSKEAQRAAYSGGGGGGGSRPQPQSNPAPAASNPLDDGIPF